MLGEEAVDDGDAALDGEADGEIIDWKMEPNTEGVCGEVDGNEIMMEGSVVSESDGVLVGSKLAIEAALLSAILLEGG